MTDFQNGDRVLAPHPDHDGQLRAAKMYGPGNDIVGVTVSVQFEDGNGTAVNVPGNQVVKIG